MPKDPPSGTVLPVAAGSTLNVAFTCDNGEHKVVSFAAEITGLGPWAPARTKAMPVVPFESGQLVVAISPAADAEPGDYPFSLKLFCDDDPVEANGAVDLVMRVIPANSPATSPAIPVTKEETVEPPKPPEEEKPKVVPIPEPVVVAKPEPKPAPPPPKPPEPKIVTLPDPVVAEEEPDPVIDFAADQVVVNPAEGTRLYVKPGEKLLVRISIRNDQDGVRTYVLQEDRSLPSDWIALVRDQVNITPGGTGDVAFALKPPPNAEPASYPFTVSSGILGRGLLPCHLVLTVQSTPAVTLSAKKDAVSVGPFARLIPFELAVATAGNADTAYRVSVVDDSPAPDGLERGRVDVYETPTWQYLFDKECETLESPSAGRTPPPVPHRLRLGRKGTWWFGWRESHKVKVVAVPVTDVTNGGKAGNEVALTASRWRLLPMPAFVMFPLFALLLVLLASGGDDFRVLNGLQGDDGTYYVVGTEPNQPKLDVRLAWNAPFYSVLKLEKVDRGRVKPIEKSGKQATDAAEVIEYGQAQRVTYELGSKFFGRGEKADVRLVPNRTKDMLRLSLGGALVKTTPTKTEVGEARVPITTREVTVVVPSIGTASLNFQNLTGKGRVNGQTIVLWTVRNPAGYRISDFLTRQGDNQVINPGAAPSAKISLDPANPPTEEESVWELLTTDGSYQLLRIKLKKGAQ
jgi:hypothetical protein